jgi:hypothetical protein
MWPLGTTLGEREFDVAVTTLANDRNALVKYVIPFLDGRQPYTLDDRVPGLSTVVRCTPRPGAPLPLAENEAETPSPCSVNDVSG